MTKPTILVVEDELIVGMDLRMMLEQFGYCVPAVIASGEEAVRQALALRPNLILMDVRLRGLMDGIAAAEAIGKVTRIPLVYLTAYADEATLSRARLTTPYGYLVKPFDEPTLRTTVEMALVRAEAEQERLARLRQEEEVKHAERLQVLTSGVAHDLNNLLTVVYGHVDLLRLDLGAYVSAHESLDQIAVTVRRATDLIQQLLAYAGRARLKLALVDADMLIRETSKLVKPLIVPRITLHIRLEHALLPIHADAVQVQQVLMNLLLNAAEAIGDQPGTITVAAETKMLDTATRQAMGRAHPLDDRPYLVIAVSDTGCGMDSATRERVFEPFFTTKSNGRGLGLAATYGIVREHNGAISVESTPGHGTTFVIVLPTAAPLAPPLAADPVASDATTRGTVLVIDDEDAVRALAARMIQRLGFQALMAEGGSNGLALADQHLADISVVLLDLTMPGMAGDRVAQELRKLRPDLPIILTTGDLESQTIAELISIPHTAYLPKPFSLDELQRQLQRFVGQAAE